MAQTFVGTLKTLWRYPVKSMQGEELETSDVGKKGLLGDRAYALWDVATSRVASAKNPKKWAALLNCDAKFAQTPDTSKPLPPVEMSLANGLHLSSEQADLNTHLSDWIGREVEFLTSPLETPILDQYWPDVEGRAYRNTVKELLMPTGTFFDSCPIHALTTATLAHLQTLYPTGNFALRRFRPNLLIETDSHATGFVENDWVGHMIRIGESVTLQVDTCCPRCVVTTLAQGELPEDLEILKTTARHNNVIAGIRLSVKQGGTIHIGDRVSVEPLHN
ncbi:MAG: MOSC domain-containing protein [Halothece sp. Uz-M2-17]|nr:MOSC domain-containing protein [Halothece sp. Uz-M2-17]